MMLPIGIAIICQVSGKGVNQESNFGKVLMLGIAYSASIGGFSTLYGTPPNLILKSNFEQFFNFTMDFDYWFIMALPLSILLLIICWIYLVNFSFSLSSASKINKDQIINKLKELGKMKSEEIIVLIIFSAKAKQYVNAGLTALIIFTEFSSMSYIKSSTNLFFSLL